MSPFQACLLAATALVASALAAITGFGGAAVLLPVLVAFFGARHAVPILTVAQLIGNGSRVWFNRTEVEYRSVIWFSVGAIPAALLAGPLFASTPQHLLTRAMGAFLILIVFYRHLPGAKSYRPALSTLPVFGAGLSFLSTLMGSVGPLMAPLFLALGFVKGAYIGTEALATVVIHLVKIVAYERSLVMDSVQWILGLAMGPVMVLGSFAGKKILDHISPKVSVRIVEAVLLVSGCNFLFRG